MKKLLALLALLVATSASATLNFPATVDDDNTLHLLLNGEHYITTFHNGLKDAIKQLEAKVGADPNGAGVASSLDYKLTNSLSIDPGHKHTSASISFLDGSVSSPGIVFGSPVTDTNTGFFHPGTGIVAVAISGSEKVRVTSVGTGFGTANPQFQVDVAGTLRVQSGNFLCFGGTGGADNDSCMSRSGAHIITDQGSIILQDQAAADVTLSLKGIVSKTGGFLAAFLLSGDSQPSFRLNADGVTLAWGPGGSTATDTTFGRNGVGSLATPGTLQGATVTATGSLTTTAQLIASTMGSMVLVNGTNDNFALGTASTYYRVTGPTGAFTLTGMANGVAGRVVILRSTVSQTWTITNQATSSAANQINTTTGANIVCTATEQATITLVYDSTDSKWVVVSVMNCATT